MSKRQGKTRAARRKRSRRKNAPRRAVTDYVEPAGDRRRAEAVTIAFLVIVGLIYSLHFFGYFAFPNPDFSSFLGTGRQWLDFEIPGMKRAPVFSIITVLAGVPFSRPDRNLVGTELYNAVMLAVVMVLIYFIGRRFLGRAAVWTALLAGISPWMIRMSSQPLLELTLVAVFAGSVLCVRKHTGWAYFFAMIGSITRWDMAALIPAVAVVDLVRNRKWFKTAILTALASIPFVLCMIITVVQLQRRSGGGHYLQILTENRAFALFVDLGLYRRQICSFLNAQMLRSLPSGAVVNSTGLNTVVLWLTATLLAAAFVTGSVAAVIKRRWEIIVMLLTGIPYIAVHAAWVCREPRYGVPVGWAGLLIGAYGIIILWQWFARKSKVKPLIPAFQFVGAIIFALWAIKICGTLTEVRNFCPVVGRLAAVSSLVVVGGFFVLQLLRRPRRFAAWLIIPAFLVLAVVSNAATTGIVMQKGKTGENFRQLGRWFFDNAADSDRMITTMPSFMPIFTGLPRERFVHIASIKPEQAGDFSAFVQECRRRDITLVAWDSRLAGVPDNPYYKTWGLDRIEDLAAPFLGRDIDRIDDCKLIHTISEGLPRIAIYRIMPADAD